MKKNVLKYLAFALALVLITPMVAAPNNFSITTSAKAAPKLSKSSITLKGAKDSQKLTVMNPVARSTYSWSSTNKKVAKVSSGGTVTPVAKGTATIKCRIKSPNLKKAKTLSCKVKVEIPVTGIKITNAQLGDNNAHVIVAGEQYDFDFKYTPAKPSSRAYWFIEDTDIASVSGLGVVTGKKEGITTLKIVAAPNRASVNKSEIYHAVNISVVDKTIETANVETVQLNSAKELIVTFSDPIDESTVIDLGTNQLKDTISIRKNDYNDEYNDYSVDPGVLTAHLSDDLKKLTITPEHIFSGAYEIKVTSNVQTIGNIPLTVYKETFKLLDETNPVYKNTTLDETGLVSILNFNEPINIANLQIQDVVVGNAGPGGNTANVLYNRNNYQLTNDKKSIKVDLTGISKEDENKTITVILAGIEDYAKNQTSPYQLPVSVYTDTTPKPQAQIVSVKRTSYDEITVLFDRAIKSVGNTRINNTYLGGYVNSENKKEVHYRLSSAQRALRGNQKMTIGYWNGYNVMVNDDSANRYRDVIVNFDVDTTNPYITNYRLESYKEGQTTRYRLVLIFNENVNLTFISGSLSSTFKPANSNTKSNTRLYYTAEGKNKVVTLKFTGAQMSAPGTYELSIPNGLVKDVFNNSNTSRKITINRNTENNKELPGPAKIQQSPVNPSEILLTFHNKIDRGSAEKVANYKVNGKAVKDVQLIEQTETTSVVKLTLTSGNIKYDASYPIKIDGIRGYNNSFGELSDYEAIVPLKENTPPTIEKAVYDNYNNRIEITFSEQINGIPGFSVYQSNHLLCTSVETRTSIIEDKVIIFLNERVTSPSTLTLKPENINSIKDINGNKGTFKTINVD